MVLASTEVEANRDGEANILSEHGDGRGIAIAPDGTRYITGAVAAGSDTSDSNDRQPFVIALDPTGRMMWRRTWDGVGQVVAVTATDDGPVAIVRVRSPRFDADPGSSTVIVADDGRTGVAVALTLDGALRWTWSTPRAALHAIGAFSDGSVAIAGVTGTASWLGFVARVDREGRTRWHQPLRNSSTLPYAIATTDRGIFVTGVTDALRPTGSRKRPLGGASTFVARLDLGGGLDWLQKIGEDGTTSRGYAMAADSEKVVVGGLFRGRVDFDPGPGRQVRQSHDEDDDGYAVQFDTNGQFNWAFTFGANSSDQVRGIAIDASNVFALGMQTEVADLGGRVGPPDPSAKLFLVALDTDGTPVHATPLVTEARLGGYPPVYIGSMTVHDHHVFVMGEVSRSTTVMGRSFVPVGPPGKERSPIWLEVPLD